MAVSRMAKEDIEQLQSEGLTPTIEDIIRLNSVALKFEAAKKKHSTTDIYLLPRVAQISDGICFRQPTIGHEIWLKKVSEYIDTDELQTVIALQSYCLSRDCASLPDAYDKKLVCESIQAFIQTLSEYTEDQIFAALDYVRNGCDQFTGEEAEPKKTDEEDEDEEDDWRFCLALGTLRRGQAILWGINEREMMSMTERNLNDVIERSYAYHNLPTDTEANYELAGYYRTYDKIKERLTREKEENQKEEN